jgi:isopentenyl-diphosphate Delta-isomerase
MRAQPLCCSGVSRAVRMLRAPAEGVAESGIIPGIAADGGLYPIEKMEAHRQGALHLAVSVFVMSGDALLLQRRALTKYHCGGLWANTCCSHPHWGEAPADSAARRLYEELGVTLTLRACNIVEYKARVTDGLWEHERVHIFRGEAAATVQIRPDPAEVLETRWVSIEELRQDVRVRPEVYAPWFRIYLERWDELGL